MPTYILALSASEIVRLLRAETEAAQGQPELDITAWREYVIEEGYKGRAYGLHGFTKTDLVSAVAVLAVEPRMERDYWVLEVSVERALGPLAACEDDLMAYVDITLDAFDAALHASGRKRVTVRLDVETAAARQHFDRWLGEMRARHPAKPPAGRPRPERMKASAPVTEESGMTDNSADTSSWSYTAREAVGVFADPDTLERAVDELEVSGFDRAAISVLALSGNSRAKAGVERFYRSVADFEDSGSAPRGAFASRDSRIEGGALAVGVPFYIGGVAGALAVVASGGALAPAFAAALAGGTAAGGLGALLAGALSRRHSTAIAERLQKGGLVLWVSVPDHVAEGRALAVLQRMGGVDVHLHEIEREWSLRDIPFAEAQPDPFLERDPK